MKLHSVNIPKPDYTIIFLGLKAQIISLCWAWRITSPFKLAQQDWRIVSQPDGARCCCSPRIGKSEEPDLPIQCVGRVERKYLEKLGWKNAYCDLITHEDIKIRVKPNTSSVG